jgi:DNA/RNA-binding domain of Phe-tRNA-synthetase-like protein
MAQAHRPRTGWIADDVAADFPDLALHWVQAPVPRRRATAAVKRQLREMSDRYRATDMVNARHDPIVQAHRIFFRHIGLDPDVERPPYEAAAVQRLKQGAFRSRSLVQDAITIATVETGVGVHALDPPAPVGVPGIRTPGPGERLAAGADPVPPRRLLVAGAEGPLGLLFGDAAPGLEVTRGTTSVLLVAVRVPGVAAVQADEAVWLAASILAAPIR